MASRKASLIRMARILLFTATLAAGLLGGAMLHAQLLPPVGQVIGDAARFPGAVAGDVVAPVGEVVRSSTQLARDRITRLTQFASRNRAAIELDEAGEPAVRGEVLAVDPDQATMRAATEAGFTILRDERIEELDLRSVTLRPPQGWPLRKAIQRLRRIAPKGEFTPNHLLLPEWPVIHRSGLSSSGALSRALPARAAMARPSPR
jgi:hypothetical protein